MSGISSAADTVVLSGLYSAQDIVAMSGPRSAAGIVAMLGECFALYLIHHSKDEEKGNESNDPKFSML
jgi:hypothetical protein